MGNKFIPNGDVEFLTTCRIDTPVEIEYYRNGGILHTVLRRMLKGGTGRTGAAGNLANVDTPGYKPRDVDFQAAGRHAMQLLIAALRGEAPPPRGSDLQRIVWRESTGGAELAASGRHRTWGPIQMGDPEDPRRPLRRVPRSHQHRCDVFTPVVDHLHDARRPGRPRALLRPRPQPGTHAPTPGIRVDVRGKAMSSLEEPPADDAIAVEDPDPIRGRIEPLGAGIRDEIGSLEHHLAGVVELARVHHRDHGVEIQIRVGLNSGEIGLAQRASDESGRQRGHDGSRHPGHGSPPTGAREPSSSRSARRTSSKSS